jgi:hypothetical protein
MANDPPNVLFLMSDQHSFRHLGHQNATEGGESEPVHTSTLDRLAESSGRFGNAYCAAPLCTPSRLSLLTGREEMRAGGWGNSAVLQPDLPTLPGRSRRRDTTPLSWGRCTWVATASSSDSTIAPTVTSPGSWAIRANLRMRRKGTRPTGKPFSPRLAKRISSKASCKNRTSFKNPSLFCGSIAIEIPTNRGFSVRRSAAPTGPGRPPDGISSGTGRTTCRTRKSSRTRPRTTILPR